MHVISRKKLREFIGYQAQVLLARDILTHPDYDKDRWKYDRYYDH